MIGSCTWRRYVVICRRSRSYTDHLAGEALVQDKRNVPRFFEQKRSIPKKRSAFGHEDSEEVSQRKSMRNKWQRWASIMQEANVTCFSRTDGASQVELSSNSKGALVWYFVGVCFPSFLYVFFPTLPMESTGSSFCRASTSSFSQCATRWMDAWELPKAATC